MCSFREWLPGEKRASKKEGESPLQKSLFFMPGVFRLGARCLWTKDCSSWDHGECVPAETETPACGESGSEHGSEFLPVDLPMETSTAYCGELWGI